MTLIRSKQPARLRKSNYALCGISNFSFARAFNWNSPFFFFSSSLFFFSTFKSSTALSNDTPKYIAHAVARHKSIELVRSGGGGGGGKWVGRGDDGSPTRGWSRSCTLDVQTSVVSACHEGWQRVNFEETGARRLCDSMFESNGAVLPGGDGLLIPFAVRLYLYFRYTRYARNTSRRLTQKFYRSSRFYIKRNVASLIGKLSRYFFSVG